MQKPTLKRALVSSVLSIVLCFSMLLGTTFAWFTDSVTSANNVVKTGTLDVQLFQWTDKDTSVEITNESEPLFGDDLLWEPNKTEVVYLSIKNNGTLALKYKVALDVTLGEGSDENHDLTDVMYYAIAPDAQYGEVTAWDADAAVKTKLGKNATAANDVTLLPGEEHFFALSVHMDEEAENKYMGDSIYFNIKVLAGQLAHEEDEFGKEYDKYSAYPGTGYAPALSVGESAAEIRVLDDEGYKVGSLIIPADAVDPAATQYSANVSVVDYDYNFTVADGSTVTTYEVTVEGVKEGNTTPIKVQLKIAPGLDPDTVKLYHYNDEIECTYNPNTGYVTFETATFSPFSVVYDATSVYTAPVITYPEDGSTPEGFPTALINEKPEYENVDLDWGSYGAWSPTEELDSQLEVAYEFACTETLEEAKESDFAQWHCDFYVMLDKDLGANQLFLGGNYGSFGWVGFHNGDLELEANTEVPLLGSVTSNPWTYLDVVQNVGEFVCGVGDVDNALSGAKFTVMLRLTNPDNEAEFYNVATVEYTFR